MAKAGHSAPSFAAVGGGYLLLVLCNTFTPIRDLLITNRVLVLTGQAMEIPSRPSAVDEPCCSRFYHHHAAQRHSDCESNCCKHRVHAWHRFFRLG